MIGLQDHKTKKITHQILQSTQNDFHCLQKIRNVRKRLLEVNNVGMRADFSHTHHQHSGLPSLVLEDESKISML